MLAPGTVPAAVACSTECTVVALESVFFINCQAIDILQRFLLVYKSTRFMQVSVNLVSVVFAVSSPPEIKFI